MRHLLLSGLVGIMLCLLMLGGIALYRGQPFRPTAAISVPVDDFLLPVLGELEVMTRTSLLGHKTILHIFAPWCVTCRQDHEALAPLKNAAIKLYGICWKCESQALQQFINDNAPPYDLIARDTDGQMIIGLGATGLPETLVLDGHAIIRYHHAGPLTSKQIHEISHLLGQP